MGLDISFNAQEALKAGMSIELETRGSGEDIEKEILSEHLDKDYLSWLQETVLIGSFLFFEDSFEVDFLDGRFFVRANEWGRLYKPLTKFLNDNDIVWERL